MAPSGTTQRASRGAARHVFFFFFWSPFVYEYTKARFSLKAFLMLFQFPFPKRKEFYARLEIDDATHRAHTQKDEARRSGW